MNGLRLLLDEAVEHAEGTAPVLDPVQALARRRRSLRERRGAAVTLAFVGFVLLLQAVPHPALGAAPPPAGAVAAAR